MFLLTAQSEYLRHVISQQGLHPSGSKVGAVFREFKVAPAMASVRIQHWALLVGAHDHYIEYKSGKKKNNLIPSKPSMRLPVEPNRLIANSI